MGRGGRPSGRPAALAFLMDRMPHPLPPTSDAEPRDAGEEAGAEDGADRQERVIPAPSAVP
jgi:hypothetical protein